MGGAHFKMITIAFYNQNETASLYSVTKDEQISVGSIIPSISVNLRAKVRIQDVD